MDVSICGFLCCVWMNFGNVDVNVVYRKCVSMNIGYCQCFSF
jgi:hypothetical protein